MPRRWKIARSLRRAAAAWPARISSLVASVTCRLAAVAISRSRWSIASASSTPPAPPPITMTLSGPRQVVMRSAELEPAPAELGDRLDRDRPLLGTRDGPDIGRRADIDRQQVVAERRLVLQQHPPPGAIDAGRLGMDQPHARSGAELRQVDVALREAVAAGDEARDHAGVGRLDIAADQRHRRVLQRPLAELLQDMDVGMAAADQHQILHHRPVYPTIAGTGTLSEKCCISILYIKFFQLFRSY